jgi:hypothetical protein
MRDAGAVGRGKPLSERIECTLVAAREVRGAEHLETGVEELLAVLGLHMSRDTFVDACDAERAEAVDEFGISAIQVEDGTTVSDGECGDHGSLSARAGHCDDVHQALLWGVWS